MTVKEFYDKIGADYKSVLSRLMKDTLIVKFLNKYKDDTSFDKLEKCVKDKNYEEAFSAAHTLKGLALNLGLSKLGGAASDLTEYLRGGGAKDAAKVESLMSPIRRYQKEVLQNLSNLS